MIYRMEPIWILTRFLSDTSMYKQYIIAYVTIPSLLLIQFCNTCMAAEPPTEVWSSGGDIMIDAFSNNIMSPSTAPVTYEPLSPEESADLCTSADTFCSKVTDGFTFSYKKIENPGVIYLLSTLTNTSTSSITDIHQLSYIYEISIPVSQKHEDIFLTGLSSKNIIKKTIDNFLYNPKNQLETPGSNKWLTRLNHYFSTTDIESNFSDINFKELTTGFSNSKNINKKNIRITQETKIDEIDKTNTEQLLHQVQNKDNSGVEDITWLEAEETSAAQVNATNNREKPDTTLSYQRYNNISEEESKKEIEQDFPQSTNPFNWNSDSLIDFSSNSPF